MRFILTSIFVLCVSVNVSASPNPNPPATKNIMQRVAAVKVLATEKGAQAVPDLIKQVQDPKEVLEVKAASLQALAEIGDQKAIAFLLSISKDPQANVRVRRYAIKSLIKVSKGKYVDQIADGLLAETDPVMHSKILREIADYGGEHSVEVLKQYLKAQKDPHRRILPLQILMKYDTSYTVPFMLKELAISTDKQNIILYSHALGKSGDKRAIKPLIQRLKNPQDPGLIKPYVMALTFLKAKEAIPVLASFIEKNDPSMAAYAVAAIIEIDKPSAFETLTRMYNEKSDAFNAYLSAQKLDSTEMTFDDNVFYVGNFKTRLLIIEGLAKIDPEKAIPFFKMASRPSDILKKELGENQLRQNAIKILGKTNDKAVAEFLIQQHYLEEENLQLRLTTLRAINQLLKQEAIPIIIPLTKDKHPYMRKVAAEALGKYQDKRVIEPLAAMLDDEVSLVRVLALRGLANQHSAESRKIIQEVINNTDDDQVRKVAKQLLNQSAKNGK